MKIPHNVAQFGQVFTPANTVRQMLSLRRNRQARTLEPSSGEGAFVEALRAENTETIAIELDKRWAGEGVMQMDFFDYPDSELFDCIIGNPPYVRYRDILPTTKAKLNTELFDERSNLYLFFIEKCVRQLREGGELIFITPRDFLKATSARKLNEWLYTQGTITDAIDLGDARIFDNHSPNCLIFRFQKGDTSRQMSDGRKFICERGQLLFLKQEKSSSVRLGDIFRVCVGAVSGADKIFSNEKDGNADFVCSRTQSTGQTRRMIFNTPHPTLLPYKTALLARKIRPFSESNWWQWGRMHHISEGARIYVNGKTRQKNPFFLHPSNYYDGSILALFPKVEMSPAQLAQYCEKLNKMDWQGLGFLCDGRYLFSQRSLENCPLEADFAHI